MAGRKGITSQQQPSPPSIQRFIWPLASCFILYKLNLWVLDGSISLTPLTSSTTLALESAYRHQRIGFSWWKGGENLRQENSKRIAREPRSNFMAGLLGWAGTHRKVAGHANWGCEGNSLCCKVTVPLPRVQVHHPLTGWAMASSQESLERLSLGRDFQISINRTEKRVKACQISISLELLLR